ncbi:uncharacterized protein LOC125868675 [Solanum stenotomum]|uniref:uncharacterized protein LOC125868675 n=1 Tax=Solanum stenotomum TaxID=172797 RepID=UPI0020D0EC5D|nr:uncharacterized protein LOC125868675 [Solanum stenotomum]
MVESLCGMKIASLAPTHLDAVPCSVSGKGGMSVAAYEAKLHAFSRYATQLDSQGATPSAGSMASFDRTCYKCREPRHMKRDYSHPRMVDPAQKQTRAVVIMVDGVHKVVEEGISKAVEAGEIVMQVEEQCNQARRSPVKMTGLSVMPFRSKEEHADYLRIVLGVLGKQKLYANISKCEFWLDSIAFLGHVVSRKVVMVDPQKIETVSNWVWLSSVTEVRSFMGIVSYYRRFVKKFASIATHLTRLPKNELSISVKCGVLASIEVRPTFIEEIKVKLFEDGNLNELKKKTVSGKAQDVVLDAGGVLSFMGRICVPELMA